MMIPDENTFVRVGTPSFPPVKLAGKTVVNMPPGNLAVVRDLPPMGTKFHTAAQIGPQGTTPLVSEPYQGTVYFQFESGNASAKNSPFEPAVSASPTNFINQQTQKI
jgi:hypothetical protein